MGSRRSAYLGWTAMIGVALLAVVAGVDAFTGSAGKTRAGAPAGTRAAGDVLSGPDAPPPGALPGRLLLAEPGGCRLRVVDLATLALGRPGPETACRVWPSPSGERAAVTRAGAEGVALRAELWLVRLDDPPRYERRLGVARAAPAWSPDGRLVAWCRADGASAVLDVATGAERSYPGCFPEIVAGGAVVTRERRGRSTIVRENGRPLLGEAELARAFGPDGPRGPFVRVFAAGVSGAGDLVLGVRRAGSSLEGEAAIGTWRGRELAGSVRLPTPYGPAAIFFGLRIEPSPDGTQAALVFPESLTGERPDDLAGIVDLRSGRLDTRLAGERYQGLAWAPEGGWLALSDGAEIRVYADPDGDPAYVLPVAARALAWLRA